MTYHKIIHDLIYNHYLFEPRDNITLQAIEYNLKKSCPGSYTLMWENPQNSNDIVFKWNDKEEAILWYLKWS